MAVVDRKLMGSHPVEDIQVQEPLVVYNPLCSSPVAHNQERMVVVYNLMLDQVVRHMEAMAVCRDRVA